MLSNRNQAAPLGATLKPRTRYGFALRNAETRYESWLQNICEISGFYGEGWIYLCLGNMLVLQRHWQGIKVKVLESKVTRSASIGDDLGRDWVRGVHVLTPRVIDFAWRDRARFRFRTENLNATLWKAKHGLRGTLQIYPAPNITKPSAPKHVTPTMPNERVANN